MGPVMNLVSDANSFLERRGTVERSGVSVGCRPIHISTPPPPKKAKMSRGQIGCVQGTFLFGLGPVRRGGGRVGLPTVLHKALQHSMDSMTQHEKIKSRQYFIPLIGGSSRRSLAKEDLV